MKGQLRIDGDVWLILLLLCLCQLTLSACGGKAIEGRMDTSLFERVSFIESLNLSQKAWKKTPRPDNLVLDGQGQLYLVDAANDCIQVFSPSGKFLQTFGPHLAGGISKKVTPANLDSPRGVAVDQEGKVHVADTNNHRILIFDREGNLIRAFGRKGDGNGEFRFPHSVALDSKGRIYVADTGNDRIQICGPDGIFLSKFGRRGEEAGRFREPVNLRIDGKDTIYVVDRGNHRIQKFDSNLAVLWVSGRKGKLHGQFMDPAGIDLDGQGNLYVADQGNCRVQVLDGSNGRFLYSFGCKGKGPGEFKEPSGVACYKEGGRVYIADIELGQVQILEVKLAKPLTPSPPKEASGESPPSTSQEEIAGFEPRIAVLDFENDNAQASEFQYGRLLSQMTITALVFSRRFEVVERSQLEKVLKEQALSQSGIIKEPKKLGELLNVDLILVGNVARYPQFIEVFVRLVDVETGKILAATSGRVKDDAELSEATNALIENIISGYDALSGQISGMVQPIDSDATIKAFRGGKIKGQYRINPLDGRYTIRGLPPGNYRLRVEADGYNPEEAKETIAVRAGKESSNNNFKLTISTRLPKVPSGLRATGGDREIQLNWDPSDEKDLVGYKISRSILPSSGFSQIGSSMANFYMDKGLKNGTTYYYQIVSYFRNGIESARSSIVAATTLDISPAIPTGVSGSIDIEKKGVRLTWNRNAEPNVSGYKIYRSRVPEGLYELLGSVTTNSYLDQAIEEGQTYYYKVSACTDSGIESPQSKFIALSIAFRP
ncbi:MAG: FlgO family outer membrane protein [bacterium]